jgi:hypothetical protein
MLFYQRVLEQWETFRPKKNYPVINRFSGPSTYVIKVLHGTYNTVKVKRLTRREH